MFKDAWDPAYFSQVVILVNAKLGCFLQAALSGPRIGRERVDNWFGSRLGNLQDGYDGWTMVSER